MKKINQWIVPATASAVFLASLCLQAQDWSQWRGANRDGKTAAFAVPATWPTNLTQKWKITVGKSDSSPVLVGDNLYVFARRGTEEVLFCLDAATGNERWHSAYAADYVVTGPAKDHPGPRSSPVVASGKVCTLGICGILTCFDAAKGTILWQKKFTNDFLGVAYKSESAMSPIVEDGRCIVHVGPSTNGAVVCFDLATGEAKWKWDGDGPANSSPVTMTVGGKKQLVFLTAKKLVGLDLADGKLLWQTAFAAESGNNATPVVAGTTVFCTGQGRGLAAVKVEQQGGAFTATPLWSTTKFPARYATPVFKDGFLYGSYNGHLYCADATTGAPLWDEAASLGDTASLVDAGTVMFALGGKGQLVAFKPGTTYTRLAQMALATTETWAHPVIAGNRIFVKDNETVGLWGLQ
jgi:outer membrane protein assembly factor BamB